ncbi:MAG: hypothetical protein PHV29_03190 [Candidatus Pacebacteria bacterium]|nr:hypothetical protein [Candidatus Paceibacterota bacterium]
MKKTENKQRFAKKEVSELFKKIEKTNHMKYSYNVKKDKEEKQIWIVSDENSLFNNNLNL